MGDEPGRFVLNKVNSESKPISNKEYTITYGTFSNCIDWIYETDFGNSGFMKLTVKDCLIFF